MKPSKPLHPMAVHVSKPVGGHHTVLRVGKKVRGIRVGEKLNSTHLDDLGEIGHKVREVKESTEINEAVPRASGHNVGDIVHSSDSHEIFHGGFISRYNPTPYYYVHHKKDNIYTVHHNLKRAMKATKDPASVKSSDTLFVDKRISKDKYEKEKARALDRREKT